MTTTTRKPGFYGTPDSTYYLAADGIAYCVQTDDLRDCPFRVEAIPVEATECDDLLDGEEQAGLIRSIEGV
jgi:hypothetical protein